MSRYRPPQPRGSKFITPQGAARLKQELDHLWRVLRPQAAQGDRSENAEYSDGKRQLREIDRRVRFLRQRLDGMVVVGSAPPDRTRVFFGAWVKVEDEAGAEAEYRIVGPDEFDAAPGYISMDSPLGRALRGKALDDEVKVELPGGVKVYEIVAVRYEELQP